MGVTILGGSAVNGTADGDTKITVLSGSLTVQDIDMDQYERLLGNVMLLGTFGKIKAVSSIIFDWNPNDHPRNWLGEFIKTPDDFESVAKEAKPGDVILTKSIGGDMIPYKVVDAPQHKDSLIVNRIDKTTGEIQDGTTEIGGQVPISIMEKGPTLGVSAKLKHLEPGTFVQRPDTGKRYVISNHKAGPDMPQFQQFSDTLNEWTDADLQEAYDSGDPGPISLISAVADQTPYATGYTVEPEPDSGEWADAAPWTWHVYDPEGNLIGNTTDTSAVDEMVSLDWEKKNHGWVTAYQVDNQGAIIGKSHSVFSDAAEMTPSPRHVAAKANVNNLQTPGDLPPPGPPNEGMAIAHWLNTEYGGALVPPESDSQTLQMLKDLGLLDEHGSPANLDTNWSNWFQNSVSTAEESDLVKPGDIPSWFTFQDQLDHARVMNHTEWLQYAQKRLQWEKHQDVQDRAQVAIWAAAVTLGSSTGAAQTHKVEEFVREMQGKGLTDGNVKTTVSEVLAHEVAPYLVDTHNTNIANAAEAAFQQANAHNVKAHVVPPPTEPDLKQYRDMLAQALTDQFAGADTEELSLVDWTGIDPELVAQTDVQHAWEYLADMVGNQTDLDVYEVPGLEEDLTAAWRHAHESYNADRTKYQGELQAWNKTHGAPLPPDPPDEAGYVDDVLTWATNEWGMHNLKDEMKAEMEALAEAEDVVSPMEVSTTHLREWANDYLEPHGFDDQAQQIENFVTKFLDTQRRREHEMIAYEQEMAAWRKKHPNALPKPEAPTPPTEQQYADAVHKWFQDEGIDTDYPRTDPDTGSLIPEEPGKSRLHRYFDEEYKIALAADAAVDPENPNRFEEAAMDAAKDAYSRYAQDPEGLVNSGATADDPEKALQATLHTITNSYIQQEALYQQKMTQYLDGDLGDNAVMPDMPKPPRKYPPGAGKGTMIVIEQGSYFKDKTSGKSVSLHPDVSPAQAHEGFYVIKRVPIDDPDAAGRVIDTARTYSHATEIAQAQTDFEPVQERRMFINYTKIPELQEGDLLFQEEEDKWPNNNDGYVDATGRVWQLFAKQVHDDGSVWGYTGTYHGGGNDAGGPAELIDANGNPTNILAGFIRVDAHDDILYEYSHQENEQGFDPNDQPLYMPRGWYRQKLRELGALDFQTEDVRQQNLDAYIPELRHDWDYSELHGASVADAEQKLNKLGYVKFNIVPNDDGQEDQYHNIYGTELRVHSGKDGKVTAVDEQRQTYTGGAASAKDLRVQLEQALADDPNPGSRSLGAELNALDPSHDSNPEGREALVRQMVFNAAVRNKRGQDHEPERPVVKLNAEYEDELRASNPELFDDAAYIANIDKPRAKLRVDGVTRQDFMPMDLYDPNSGYLMLPEGMPEDQKTAIAAILSNSDTWKMVHVSTSDEPLFTVGDWYGTREEPQQLRTLADLPDGAVYEAERGSTGEIATWRKVGYDKRQAITEDGAIGAISDADLTERPIRFALPHHDILDASKRLARDDLVDAIGPNAHADGESALGAAIMDRNSKYRDMILKVKSERISQRVDAARAAEGTVAQLPYEPSWDLPSWDNMEMRPQTMEDINAEVSLINGNPQDVPVFFTGGLVRDGVVLMGNGTAMARVPHELDDAAEQRLVAAGAMQVSNSQDLNDIYSYGGSGAIYAGHMLLIEDAPPMDDMGRAQALRRMALDWASKSTGPNGADYADEVKKIFDGLENTADSYEAYRNGAQGAIVALFPGGAGDERWKEYFRRQEKLEASFGFGRRIEYVQHAQDGDLSPDYDGLTTGAPSSQRGQLRLYGYTPEEAIHRLQEIGLVHDLEPEVPFTMIMRGSRRHGHPTPLLNDYANGREDPPVIEHSIVHGVTGGMDDLVRILDTGAVLPISERVRLGIAGTESSSTSAKGDIRSGIDHGVFSSIGGSSWGSGVKIHYRDSVYLRRDLITAPDDFGGQATRYGNYADFMDEARKAVGEEPTGSIYDPLSPKARQWIINRVLPQASNEWNAGDGVAIEDWEYVRVPNEDDANQVRRKLGQLLREGRVTRVPLVVTSEPSAVKSDPIHQALAQRDPMVEALGALDGMAASLNVGQRVHWIEGNIEHTGTVAYKTADGGVDVNKDDGGKAHIEPGWQVDVLPDATPNPSKTAPSGGIPIGMSDVQTETLEEWMAKSPADATFEHATMIGKYTVKWSDATGLDIKSYWIVKDPQGFDLGKVNEPSFGDDALKVQELINADMAKKVGAPTVATPLPDPGAVGNYILDYDPQDLGSWMDIADPGMVYEVHVVNPEADTGSEYTSPGSYTVEKLDTGGFMVYDPGHKAIASNQQLPESVLGAMKGHMAINPPQSTPVGDPTKVDEKDIGYAGDALGDALIEAVEDPTVEPWSSTLDDWATADTFGSLQDKIKAGNQLAEAIYDAMDDPDTNPEVKAALDDWLKAKTGQKPSTPQPATAEQQAAFANATVVGDQKAAVFFMQEQYPALIQHAKGSGAAIKTSGGSVYTIHISPNGNNYGVEGPGGEDVAQGQLAPGPAEGAEKWMPKVWAQEIWDHKAQSGYPPIFDVLPEGVKAQIKEAVKEHGPPLGINDGILVTTVTFEDGYTGTYGK